MSSFGANSRWMEFGVIGLLLFFLSAIAYPFFYDSLSKARDTNRFKIIRQYEENLHTMLVNGGVYFPTDISRAIPPGEQNCADIILAQSPVYMQIAGVKELPRDPAGVKNPAIAPCIQSGSLYYREIREAEWVQNKIAYPDRHEEQYGVVIAIRMENPQNANHPDQKTLSLFDRVKLRAFVDIDVKNNSGVTSDAADYLYVIPLKREK